jgi:hypothetical protein
LNATVSESPKELKDVFTQSAAEEIIRAARIGFKTSRNSRRLVIGRYDASASRAESS